MWVIRSNQCLKSLRHIDQSSAILTACPFMSLAKILSCGQSKSRISWLLILSQDLTGLPFIFQSFSSIMVRTNFGQCSKNDHFSTRKPLTVLTCLSLLKQCDCVFVLCVKLLAASVLHHSLGIGLPCNLAFLHQYLSEKVINYLGWFM